MFDIETISLFLLASLVLLLTPGPAILYIVARSLNQGWIAGVVAALGIHVGTLAHVVAAAIGLSQLLVTSAIAFTMVKYFGAAYLIYLGLKALFNRQPATSVKILERRELSTIFSESIIVSILNPKVALFFFAFLPQFIDPNRGSAGVQIMIFGLIFILVGIISDGLYAIFAGTIARRLKQGGLSVGRYITGIIYCGLGIATALYEPEPQE
jgi:threonine/homoserine/homoserine lactone efflux protein